MKEFIQELRDHSLNDSSTVNGSLTTREWLNTKQAAEYLGLPLGTFRNMTSDGRIPFYKLGKLNRYRVTDLRAMLLAQRRGDKHVD